MSDLGRIGSKPRSLDESGSRVWIYPKEMSGPWMRLRRAIAFVLIAIFFVSPWITLTNNVPLFRLHFTKGFFFLLGQPILVYEIYHFVLLFLFLLFLLFFVSMLLGRVWCGLACPQTIFIEHIIRNVEFFLEGSAEHRKLADQGKKTVGFVTRKILKYAFYVVLCSTFGFTLVAYFQDPHTILQDNVALVICLILAILAFIDSAYLREQFCTILCPYARFQSVFQDSFTRNVGYDESRGEPRGRARTQKHGDCIDCGLCVRVCPTGIDIRNGPNQLECVSCFRCADACNSVMDNLGRAPGLIRSAPEAVLVSSAKSQVPDEKTLTLRRWFRPRAIIYALLLLLIGSFGIYDFVFRNPIRVQLVSASNVPFFRESNEIRKMVHIKLGNQSPLPRDFSVGILQPSITDMPFTVALLGSTYVSQVAPGEVKTLPMVIALRPNKETISNRELSSTSSVGTGKHVKVNSVPSAKSKNHFLVDLVVSSRLTETSSGIAVNAASDTPFGTQAGDAELRIRQEILLPDNFLP